MVTSNNITSRIYNTGLKTASEINEEFVVRTKEFEAIWEDLETSTMQFPEQDYFIVGERGMGKTMLLTKIKYAVQQDKKLSKWLIPVAYPEEQNNVTELYDLWLNTAEYLNELNSDIFKDLSPQLEGLEINETTEEEAFRILNTSLQKERKKLLLLIDNFDEILKNISEKENRRLREIMITNSNIRIVAASANAIEHNFKYDKAFYDHFAEIKLHGLTREETNHLFRSKIKKIEIEDKIIKRKHHKLETLRQLSGGNIRNMIIFFDILLKSKKSSLMQDLEEVMERVTPYNLDKIKSLKNKQRKIIDFLAKEWDGTFVKDIANGTRLESNEVSAQLNNLIENQIVCAKNSSSRKKLYFIRDRFFNIWYLMRNSTLVNKDRVVWLVKVYESFYSKMELKHKRQHLLKRLKTKTCNTFDVFYDAVCLLYLKDYDYFQKIELHRELVEYLKDEEASFLNYLPNIDEIIDINDEKRKRVVKEILTEVSSKEELIDQDYKDSDKRKEKYLLIIEGNYSKNEKAKAYHDLGHIENRVDNFLKAIKLGSKKANLCLAHYFYKNKSYDEALKYYLKAKKLKYHTALEYIILTKKKLNQSFDVVYEYETYFNNIEKEISVAHKLAHFYEEKNNIKKAQYYFEYGLETEDLDTLECYAYFIYKNNLNIKKALSLVPILKDNISKPHARVIYSIIQLWNNNIEEAINLTKTVFRFSFSVNSQYLIEFLLLLISKRQFYVTKEIFDDYVLTHTFKPVWYTLMYYLKDDYPDEYLKMGSELKDTVEDMIARVEEMKINYK